MKRKRQRRGLVRLERVPPSVLCNADLGARHTTEAETRRVMEALGLEPTNVAVLDSGLMIVAKREDVARVMKNPGGEPC